ncbi:MAG: hypothetical protein JHC93_08740 [Parachlamydiales bacterium]|nr:hypothetical protein [Parachlamydiales bacterium]
MSSNTISNYQSKIMPKISTTCTQIKQGCLNHRKATVITIGGVGTIAGITSILMLITYFYKASNVAPQECAIATACARYHEIDDFCQSNLKICNDAEKEFKPILHASGGLAISAVVLLALAVIIVMRNKKNDYEPI